MDRASGIPIRPGVPGGILTQEFAMAVVELDRSGDRPDLLVDISVVAALVDVPVATASRYAEDYLAVVVRDGQRRWRVREVVSHIEGAALLAKTLELKDLIEAL